MNKGLIEFGLALAAALSVVACEKSSDATKSAGKAVNDAAKATGQALDDAARATGEGLETAADHAGDAIDAAGDYVNRKSVARISRESIEDLRTKWRDLRDRAVVTGGAAEDRFRKVSESMARGLDEADAKLVLAERAGADAWQDARSALEGALKKAQEMYESALVEFGG
jgi:ElaB/YqjD/DUF883 family membrane-anchored ribosome-binding protein